MENLILATYIFSVILMSSLVLTYIVKATNTKKGNDTKRLITTFICGAFLGFIWYKFISAPLDKLILSFLASMTFYTLIKKYVWSGFENLYNNGKGVI